MGLGQMAARREKVSRWESGRIAPELTAQLAIARVHHVPEQDVLRLGWPRWALLATGDAALLTPSWTPEDAIAATAITAQTTKPPAFGLAVTGSALASQIKAALGALTSGLPPPAQEGRTLVPEAPAWAQARIATLESLESGTLIPQTALFAAARAEYQGVSGLLRHYGYDRLTGARLLLLAARAAALCTWLSGALGEELRAERYALAATRAATAAGAPRHTAAYLSLLAIRHLRRGAPEDALALIRAARSCTPRPTARLAVILETREARALARLGEHTASLRAVDRAAQALAAVPPSWNPDSDPTASNIDNEYLTLAQGHVWLRLGHPGKALTYYQSLLDIFPDPAQPLSPHIAARLRPVVEAQLAVGESNAATDTVEHALALTGTLPPGIAGWFQQQLTPHARHPATRDLLNHLAEHTPTGGAFP
ncbi:hypothetical protein RB200_05205 [Streptomyces sp. PmtG]